MTRLRGFCCLLLAAALAGCAAPQTERLVGESPWGLPGRVLLEKVPFHPQEEYHCGPASLAMLLGWSGIAVSSDELAPRVFTPDRKGTLQADIVAASRRYGRVAYPVSTMRDLLRELAAGHPVIVFQNLGLSWYPVWHFAVAIGYDLGRREMLLHSGRESRQRLPMDLFERTWARTDHWAQVILPPERLPATAEEGRYLRSVVGLERAGKFSAAARAYEAALSQWPGSFGAMIGLGNSRYETGDLAGAEEAFRLAVRTRPSSAPAYNNLANVLAERGEIKEALKAAAKAVSLGGPHKPAYIKTLKKIRELENP